MTQARREAHFMLSTNSSGYRLKRNQVK